MSDIITFKDKDKPKVPFDIKVLEKLIWVPVYLGGKSQILSGMTREEFSKATGERA